MTTPEKTDATTARCRPWYRLHFTTYVLLLLAATPLALANLVEEEDFVVLDRSAPGVVKIPVEDGVVVTSGQGSQLTLRHTQIELMTSNEYGWPRSWVWFDSRAPGPSFSSATSRVDFRALAQNIAAWCAILAAAVFLGELARRRFWPGLQWSLRSMLVVVGACCVLLAWGAALRGKANRQDAIIAQIDAAWGGVYLKRWGPRWLNSFGADRYRRTVVGVALTGIEKNDELPSVLKLMPLLPALRRLDLDSTPITAADVACLSHLTKIEQLFLNDTTIGDSHLAHLGGLTNLRLLHLGGCQISDDGLAHLRSLARLESLYLSGTPIDGLGLKHVSHLPRLRVLDLSHSEIDPAGLRAMSGFRELEELYLHSTAIDDSAAIPLARLPRLRLLDVTRTHVGDRTVEMLSRSGTLKDLGLEGYTVSARTFASLKSLESLTALHIEDAWDFEVNFHASGGNSILQVGSTRIIVRRSEWNAVAESLKQLQAARPFLVIDGIRRFPAEQRTEQQTRDMDGGESVDGYPRYGGGGFF